MNSSNVFKKMLCNNMKEVKEKCIKIPCKNIKIIDDMIYFIITGRLKKEIFVFDMIKLSHCYELTNLFHACLNRLVDTLNANNFVEAVNIFEEYNISTEIVKNIYQKLLKYFHKIKEKLLKEMKNVNELPYCFLQWSEFKK